MGHSFGGVGAAIVALAMVLPAPAVRAQAPVTRADAPAARAEPLVLPLDRPALLTPRATRAGLLGLAPAGSDWLAVGERGVILRSADQGASWAQVPAPTSVTLTAVAFASPARGWAIGHAGVVLATTDGGRTWARRFDGKAVAQLALAAAEKQGDAKAIANARRLVDDGADKPFLALHFFDERRGVVVGAYGLVFGTDDGGASWASWADRIDNPKGLHLNALAVDGERIVVCGEQGLLLRSTDGGKSFQRLPSPYEGSWFAAAFLPGGRLVVAGLRGNAYRSDDLGTSFAKIDLPAPITVSALAVLRDGSLLALNQAGQAQISRDRATTFQPLAVPAGAPLTQVAQATDGRLLAASLRGVQTLAARTTP